jgi:hypothetical protein
MALQIAMTSPHGFEVDAAYVRVEAIVLLRKDRMSFRARAYNDPAMAAFSDASHECAYDLSGDNPMRQAYAYLKTLPEFAGAADC